MNKGFSFYFKNGFIMAKKALKGQSFKQKLLITFYFILSSIGKLIIFTRPIFMISDMNLVKMIDECENFSLEKAFKNCDNLQKYISLFAFSLIELLFIVIGAGIIMLPSIISWIVFPFSGDGEVASYAICIAISIILGIASLIYTFYIFLTFAPVGYICANSKDKDMSDYIYHAKKSMLNLKGVSFKVSFVHFLIYLFTDGLIIASSIISALYGGNIGAIICSILFALLVLVNVFFMIYLYLALLCSKYTIYKLAVEDENIKFLKETKTDDEEDYEDVFEETLEEDDEEYESEEGDEEE